MEALVGIKKGAKSTARFVDKYGPSTHDRLSRMASGIQGTFSINSNSRAVRPDFGPKPSRKFPGMVNERKRKKIDWDNLGMEF